MIAIYLAIVLMVICVIIYLVARSVKETNDYYHVYYPKNIRDLSEYIKQNEGPISIIGAGASQGGQTTFPNCSLINMEYLNQILEFDSETKTITVEAGMTWGELQNYIDHYNLSIAIMQSYNDFSIGGSISVNAHGRDLRYGPLIESILELQVILANGDLLTVNRQHQLFSAIVGGYGGIGVIVSATLQLTDNIRLRRHILTGDDISDFTRLFQFVKMDSSIILHNTNIFPSNSFQMVLWQECTDDLTITRRFQRKQDFHPIRAFGESLLKVIKPLHAVRPFYHSIESISDCVCTRNYEMSTSINTLKPFTKLLTTSILQEYFIPIRFFEDYLNDVRVIIKKDNINVLNLSVRWVPKNTESILSYSTEESFSFVFYISVYNNRFSLHNASIWTKELIDISLKYNGHYYLPYHLFATKEQFKKSYSNRAKYLFLKNAFDPEWKFCNNFLNQYFRE
jgi:FAD/FMN-containing dehydrogenase